MVDHYILGGLGRSLRQGHSKVEVSILRRSQSLEERGWGVGAEISQKGIRRGNFLETAVNLAKKASTTELST